MFDLEKVIKGLEECAISGKCTECIYGTARPTLVCTDLLNDALTLLKMQKFDIEALKNTIQGMVEGQCILAGSRFCADGEKKEQKEKTMGYKYCGKTRDEMNKVLDIMCAIEDRIDLTNDELDAFDIAIQCITTVINRMKDDRPIE